MASETPAAPQPIAPEPKVAAKPVPVSVRAAAAKPVVKVVVPTAPAVVTKPTAPAKVVAPKPAVTPKPTEAPVPAAPAAPAPVAIADTPAPTPAPAPAPAAPVGFQLPAAVYSPQLLESVTYDIQYYLDWYRQNQIRKKVGAHPKDEPNHSDETVLVIEAWLGGKPPTLESLEALLAHLRQLKLPEVHIILAALPNRTQRETLVQWFRGNATAELLVSFVADRNLGGGVVIRTPNHVFDFSWKQELLAGADKLAGILKRV